MLVLGLGIGASVLGMFGYQWWQNSLIHQETDDATVVGHIHPLASRVAGTVSEVRVDDNQQVRQGQILVKLDPQDYQVKVQQARAALENAKQQAQAAQSNINLAQENASASVTTAQGEVNKARAGITTAQAALAEAQSGVPTAQAAVEEAQAGVRSAQAQVAQASATVERTQTDYQRYTQLEQEGVIPRQQLDVAREAYRVAVAEQQTANQGVQQAKAKLARAQQGVLQAQAQVAQAQQGVTQAQAELASAIGNLQQAQAKGQQTQVNRAQYEAARAAISQSAANLKDAQLQLSYTNIVAPVSGTVGDKTVEVGQKIQAGTPLMAIVSNDYWVVANFKETQLRKMRPGQKVEIKIDAFGNHTFTGHLQSISPASGANFSLLPPDNATGNFTKIVQRIPVKVTFDPQSIKGYESRITPGMSAVVNVALDSD